MRPAVILLCCLSLTLTRFSAVAQSVKGLDQVMVEMKKLQSFYKAQPLSFDVKYTYAGEGTPDKTLDSLNGHIEIAGDSYRCLLDSTETIRNNRYNIILFKEDRIMYLSKPTTAMTGTDPLQVIQAVMERSGAANCGISVKGRTKVIRIDFKAGGPYRQMEMTIDTLSGYLQSMRYIMKTALLVDAPDGADAAAEQGYDEYAVVQAAFSAYRKIPADPSRYNEHTFFYKEGNEFIATQAYKDYKLFVGTPNL